MLCTVKEFRLAGIPGESPRPQVQQAAIADAVGNDTAFVTQRSIDVYVRRIREKIEEDENQQRYIKTLRSFGYCFDSSVDTFLDGFRG